MPGWWEEGEPLNEPWQEEEGEGSRILCLSTDEDRVLLLSMTTDLQPRRERRGDGGKMLKQGRKERNAS